MFRSATDCGKSPQPGSMRREPGRKCVRHPSPIVARSRACKRRTASSSQRRTGTGEQPGTSCRLAVVRHRRVASSNLRTGLIRRPAAPGNPCQRQVIIAPPPALSRCRVDMPFLTDMQAGSRAHARFVRDKSAMVLTVQNPGRATCIRGPRLCADTLISLAQGFASRIDGRHRVE